MSDLIRIKPAPALRVPFARWAVAQTPKVRTVSPSEFAVPARLFVDAPEEILTGALVDGRPYVPAVQEARLLGCGLCYEEAGEEVHPHPECPQSAAAAVIPEREGVPGEPLPPLPGEAYPPDAEPLPSPEFAPLEDAPADEDGSDSSDPSRELPDESGRFVCDACPRDFSTQRGRDLHRRQVHPEA